jgi:hypothetical protein
VEVVRIPIYALINVLDSDTEVGSSPGDGLHLYGLTGLHTINRVIACSLIYNMNLACGEGIRVDCCDTIATISDYNMTIIMLGKLLHRVILSACSYQCPVHAARTTCYQWCHMHLDWVTSFIRSELLSTLG